MTIARRQVAINTKIPLYPPLGKEEQHAMRPYVRADVRTAFMFVLPWADMRGRPCRSALFCHCDLVGKQGRHSPKLRGLLVGPASPDRSPGQACRSPQIDRLEACPTVRSLQ
jgi:hypothetical protein